ncbi:MAG: glycosyl transferase family 1, partial [Proteobacteria bacterium]|nr:glycosyl transferase family 1 [Pseudomonadota bacterium]
MTTYLAAVGDANDPLTWSGIPYHLLRAGRGAGLFDAGLALETGGVGWAGRRIGWNLARAPRLERPGGFQYSPAFLAR